MPLDVALTFEPPHTPRAGRFPPRAAGFERLLEDEVAGLAYEVRLYYLWKDYDPADGALADWGARIVGLEVLGVQSFELAAAISPETSAIAAAAWNLVELDRDALEAEATRAGIEAGVGSADPLVKLGYEPAAPSTSTLAASARQTSQHRQRKWG